MVKLGLLVGVLPFLALVIINGTAISLGMDNPGSLPSSIVPVILLICSLAFSQCALAFMSLLIWRRSIAAVIGAALLPIIGLSGLILSVVTQAPSYPYFPIALLAPEALLDEFFLSEVLPDVYYPPVIFLPLAAGALWYALLHVLVWRRLRT